MTLIGSNVVLCVYTYGLTQCASSQVSKCSPNSSCPVIVIAQYAETRWLLFFASLSVTLSVFL